MTAVGASKWRSRIRQGAVALALAGAVGVAAPAQAQNHDPSQGPGGPILVVADPGDPFGRYYAEILRAEGLNAFTVAGTGSVTAQSLAAYQVVLVAGGGGLDGAQVGALGQWVQGGGNLVVFRPAANLAPLLGLGDDAGDTSEGYIKIDTGRAPGAGLTAATMQFHGTADHRAATDAETVATLYAGASTPTSSPAVTLRSVGGAGGQAAAFMYDLARSIVQTRQGNPAWEKQKRDTSTVSIRPVDLFYGAAPAPLESGPDWLNRDKVAIPQADEQQRLLANLVTLMNLDRAPLPRFWYLPRGERAAIVMTGDDHRKGNTVGQFDAFKAASRPGCSVVDWECVRSTSYLWTDTPISDAAARAYEQQGFEIALHLDLGCADYTTGSLATAWQAQLADFGATWGVTAPRTLRTHCVTWSDWAGEPKAALAHGVRFDTNYYYASEAWVQGRPGMFTGSGFPMRFADLDGSIIDVYQAATQMNDEMDHPETNIDYVNHITKLLDGALGPNGYYGAFTMNMHTDFFPHRGAEAVLAAAQARGVPIVSSVQMLDWLDGRNGSSFQGLSADGGRVRFTIARAAGARGLEAMVPARSAYGALQGVTAGGAAVSTTPRLVKGVEYAVFDAVPGEYVATYPAPPGTPAPPVPPAPPVTTPGGASTGAAGKQPGSSSGGGGGTRTPVIRATRRGDVKLPVSCRKTTGTCRTTVRLKRSGRTAASKTVRIAAGKRVQVALRLSRATRQTLARKRSLVFTVVVTGPGSRTTMPRVRVVASR